MVDDFMRSQVVEVSKIPAYRSGIDLEQSVTIETINKGKQPIRINPQVIGKETGIHLTNRPLP
nr:hypothetical protein [Enterobacter hormaechei]